MKKPDRQISGCQKLTRDQHDRRGNYTTACDQDRERSCLWNIELSEKGVATYGRVCSMAFASNRCQNKYKKVGRPTFLGWFWHWFEGLRTRPRWWSKPSRTPRGWQKYRQGISKTDRGTTQRPLTRTRDRVRERERERD